MSRIRVIRSTVLVNKIEIPVESWSVTVGAFGSIGTVTIGTSRQALQKKEIDLLSLEDDSLIVPIDVHIDVDGEKTQIFGGSYDSNNGSFPPESVSFTGRDWAASMMDFQSAEQSGDGRAAPIVERLCNFHGLTPRITNSNVNIGTEVNGESFYMATPQPHWSILHKLAHMCNFEVRVTPQKELFFGPPNTNPPKRVFHYLPRGGEEGTTPLLSLQTENNIRRNKTFFVRVISYDPSKDQVVEGEAVCVGNDVFNAQTSGAFSYQNGKYVLGISNNQFVKSGVYSGAPATVQSLQLADLKKNKPVYYFHATGLTAQQAYDQALAIAMEIAKREFVVKGTISALPELQPHDRMQIKERFGGELERYAGRDYTISGVTHTFNMPKPGSGGDGHLTQFSALAIPPGISDDPNGGFGNP